MPKKTKRKKYQITMPYFAEELPLGALTLNRLIRVMRLSRGFTQKQTADMLGTKRQHVQKWEYGLVKPRPERMAQILDLFKYRSLTQVISRYYH